MSADTPALYPLRFEPRLVPKMWGDRRLSDLGKELPPGDEPVGESWELYDFPPGVVGDSDAWVSATVADGPLKGRTLHDLMADDELRHRLLGAVPPVQTDAGPQFPLLIKFLDAGDDLSVQVHPDDAYAASHPGAHLKNEAWTVLQAEPGSRLLKGLEAGVTRETFEQAIADGTVEDLITALPAKVGETHYLPSGTVHALGAGMLVAEVQTPSDTTYRVYDFKRKDPKTGEERELHVGRALECIDFTTAGTNPTPPVGTDGGDGVIVTAPQFTIARHSASTGIRRTLPAGSPVVLVILSGTGGLLSESAPEQKFQAGQTFLLPADLPAPALDPESDCQWLEVTFPKPHGNDR